MLKDLNPNGNHLLFKQRPPQLKKKSFFLKIKDYLISSWTKIKLWYILWKKLEDTTTCDPCGIDYTTEYINSKVY